MAPLVKQTSGNLTSGAGRRYFDKQDVELARQVELLLFPRSSPVCGWCCIGVKNHTAKVLGGDYFDFITMPDGCQALFIGDVTGHGLHASVVMSLIYGFIHHAALGNCDPRRMLAEVNTFLLHFSQRSHGVDHYFSSTLFFGVIEPQSLNMVYASAGHVPALVRRDGQVFELANTAPPVGYFNAPEIGVNTFRLERGDRLLLHTDGIIEAPNPSGERYGTERLKQFLCADGVDHMKFLEELFDDLKAFGVSEPPEDDCTAIVVDIHGTASPEDIPH